MSQAERNIVEDWAAHCTQVMFFNQGSPVQQQFIFKEFGLDPERIMADIQVKRANREPNKDRRARGETNMFRVLIKTLLSGRIITERTRGFYAAYVDMDELQAEGDRIVGDTIAEEGIRYLQEINFRDQNREKVIVSAN